MLGLVCPGMERVERVSAGAVEAQASVGGRVWIG